MKFNPLALMGDHPMMQPLRMMQNGVDPDVIAEQIMLHHPKRDQIAKVVDGKDSKQLMQVAENMCRERGTTVDEVLRSMGIER